MRWQLFTMALLMGTAALSGALARPSERLGTIELGETDVGSIKTALGYTTMLQFDGRPNSVILGDQDAFKVELVGNGLAIKPLLPKSASNLFVFTDYDRFSFKLSLVPAKEAHQSLQVKRKRTGEAIQAREEVSTTPTPDAPGQGEPLTHVKVAKRASCNEVTLTVTGMSWPKSRNNLLVQFSIRYQPKDEQAMEFEPGDVELFSGTIPARIETLQLSALRFTKSLPVVSGLLLIKQAELGAGRSLALGFSPAFLKLSNPSCLRAMFRRH